jgi:hypothetical protein
MFIRVMIRYCFVLVVAAAWNLTAKGLHGNFFEFKVETPMATDTCGGKRYRFCRACSFTYKINLWTC